MTTGKTEQTEWQTGDYGDFLGLSDEERAIVEARLEIARLERIVIDKVESWSSAILKGAYAQIQADDELRDAFEALESFEAKQKNG